MARRNLTSKHSTKLVEATEINGHEWVARIVIALSNTGRYHVRQIMKDGQCNTVLRDCYHTAKAAHDAFVETAKDEVAA
jgi:hypothetical protein